MQIRKVFWAVALAIMSAGGANAQFMTAAEVKPILDMTSGNWVSIREWDGNDLVYFTHLETFLSLRFDWRALRHQQRRCRHALCAGGMF